MKQTLLLALFSFPISVFMTACTGQTVDNLADNLASVGKSTLSSDPCAALDKKLFRLDRFTEVVKHTSAFHLEEKATAIATPGITVSNNRKQMLKDADKKYAEYSAERERYDCETPMTSNTGQVADKMSVVDNSIMSSDSCDAIDRKTMRLDRFTEVVKNTSAFHLEEKATAIPTPGITVSNNRKQMLKDADKKYAEYSAERQKFGCETPMAAGTDQIADKMVVVDNPIVSSVPRATIDKELITPDEFTTKVNNTSASHVEEKAVALPVREMTVNKEQMLRDAKKKDAELSSESQKYGAETLMTAGTGQIAYKMAVVDNPTVSSKACIAVDKKLIKLYEFMMMINNTSAFHLEEKVAAFPSPGFTVSNNKKKMLRDAERKRVELLAEREQYGCVTLEKE